MNQFKTLFLFILLTFSITGVSAGSRSPTIYHIGRLEDVRLEKTKLTSNRNISNSSRLGRLLGWFNNTTTIGTSIPKLKTSGEYYFKVLDGDKRYTFYYKTDSVPSSKVLWIVGDEIEFRFSNNGEKAYLVRANSTKELKVKIYRIERV